MTKQDIHACFISRLVEELDSITAAAKNNFATATNSEHHAESKYDTFSLESSYLARGQAKRVETLSDALERLQSLPLKDLNPTTPIQLSALVRLEADDGEKRVLFFVAAGGGERICMDGETVTLITAGSPMGQAILGKKMGDSFTMEFGIDKQRFTIVSVE